MSVISFDYPDNEREKLDAFVKSLNISLSQFIRDAIFEKMEQPHLKLYALADFYVGSIENLHLVQHLIYELEGEEKFCRIMEKAIDRAKNYADKCLKETEHLTSPTQVMAHHAQHLLKENYHITCLMYHLLASHYEGMDYAFMHKKSMDYARLKMRNRLKPDHPLLKPDPLLDQLFEVIKKNWQSGDEKTT